MRRKSMKTSNKVLLITAAVIVATTVASVLTARIVIDRAAEDAGVERSEKPAAAGGKYLQQEIDAAGFTEIAFAGGWRAQVRRGEEYGVMLRVPERYRAALQTEVRGETLQLGLNREYDIGGKLLEAQLVMPRLEAVKSVGGLDLRIEGFSGEELSLDLSGGSQVKAAGGGYERILLELKGGSDVDLLDLPAENARVEAVGASHVKLAMRGGELTSSLSGAGSLEYTGDIRRQQVTTSGVTSVAPLE
jgi:hypothetical protein